MEQLLATKLYIPPTRLKLVSRPRLTEQLNEGLHRRLTLISAPAGFGKTTLVCEWLESRQSDHITGEKIQNLVAWLSVDENDNDPVRFLSYLIAALGQAKGVDEKFAKGMLDMLRAPQPPPTESILISLINEIANNPDKIIFILDDYHSIGSAVINDALSFLLEHQPPNLHQVLVTREDPQLPLARMRARGQLNELRATGLRFTSSEAAEFLNTVMGLGLSTEDIISLEHRTEGWIAGLQLAAVSMQGRDDTSELIKAFTGSHRLVLDYLIEEVLDQQPENVQTFLLRTAILDRMNGPLCNALTDQQDGEATLLELEHDNLFIVPLDQERLWYRYHHLFSDLLRARLQKSHRKDETELHHRASKWYEENGFFDEAIEHAYRANDFNHMVDLVDKNNEAIWRGGEHTKFQRWFTKVPEELILTKPNICILSAWSLFVSGQLDEAEKTLDCLSSVDSEPPQKKKGRKKIPETKVLQGRASAIRAFLASHRGDIPQILQYSRQALDHLPDQDLSWRSAAAIALGDAYSFSREIEKGYQTRLEAYELCKAADNIYLNLIASMKLAVSMRNRGQLHQVIELCDKQMQFAKENGVARMDITGWLLAVWGEALAETNDLDGALDHVTRGVELTERGIDVAARGWAYLCMLRILYSRREMEEFEALTKKIDTFTREYHVPPWVSNIMEGWKARGWLAQNQLDQASRWADDLQLKSDQLPLPMQEYQYLVLVRILHAQGHLNESSQLLDGMLEAAESQKFTTRVIEVLILKGLTLEAINHTTEAITVLKRALTIAEPGGFFRTFLDEGPQLAKLLYKAIKEGYDSEYARQLLSGFQIPEMERLPKAKLQLYKDEFIEPLSEREIDVLKLIAEGLTNQEIAARLYLSLNTVKVHNRHIFGKLNASSRLQAVSKARTLGILSSTDD